MKHFKIICFIALLFLCTSCLGRLIEEPTFVLKDVTITSISMTGAQFTLGMDIQNTNRYDLKLKSLTFKFYLQNQELGLGSLQSAVTIPKSSTTFVRVPISASYGNLAVYIKEALSGKEIPYKFAGQARIEASFAGATIPFTKEGRIDLNSALAGSKGFKIPRNLLRGISDP